MSKTFFYIVIFGIIPLGFWAAASLKLETNITAYNLAAAEDIANYESFVSDIAPRTSTESIIVLEKESGWRTITDFQLLEEITAIWQSEPEIKKASSLANLRYPKQGIFLPATEPFFDLTKPERFRQRMEQLESYADIVSKFLTTDKKYTLVFVTVPEGMTKDLAHRLSQVVAIYPGVEAHYVQYDLIQEELQSRMRKDTILLAVISLVLILVGFYAFTHSLGGLGLIGIIIAFNIALTFLVMFALSMPFTLHMITIPCLITVLSFTDIMHILYHQQVEHSSAKTDQELRYKILQAVRVPLLLTSLTNMVGFLIFLLLSKNIHLFHFSLIALVGVAIAYLSSRFIVLRLMDKDFIYIKRTNFSSLHRVHRGISRWFGRRKKAILPSFLFATILLMSLVGVNFRIDSSEQEYALSASMLTKGQSVLQTSFFGAKQAEILLSIREGSVWEKANLDQLEQIEAAVQQIFEPLFINSPTTIVKRYHRYISHGHPAAFKIPQQLNEHYVSQLDRYKAQLGGDGIVSADTKKARIVFGYEMLTLQEARKANQQLRSLLAENNTSDIHFELSGLQYLSDEATYTFSLKILLGLLLSIFFGSTLVFFFLHSVRKSMGVLLVNLFPLLFALGIMLYWSLAITPLSLFFLSILLGICVDDSIYLITQHQKGAHSFHVVPIFITSFVLSLGFLSLACSSFAWIQPFGWIFLLGISLAYVLDFFVLPLFLKNDSE
jgi:predicted RND superfamily exporter protein